MQYAETNKQRGAACYNIGITYMELGKYGMAVKFLEQSVAVNKTRAAEQALSIAKDRQNQKRKKTTGAAAATVLLGGAAAIYLRRRYNHR